MEPINLQSLLQQLRPALKRYSKAAALLEEYWKDKYAIVWSTNDVHRAANELEVALTEEQARQVLCKVCAAHNKQYGIKWEDFTDHITDRVLGRDLTKRQLKRFVEKDVVTIQKEKSSER